MSLALYVLIAVLEIAGCFAFWAWSRLGASIIWLVPGLMGLIGFAWLLTKIDTDGAGRAYAAYGGVYVAASLAWLWLIEGRIPDRWDVMGSAICILGAIVILYGPRTT